MYVRAKPEPVNEPVGWGGSAATAARPGLGTPSEVLHHSPYRSSLIRPVPLSLLDSTERRVGLVEPGVTARRDGHSAWCAEFVTCNCIKRHQ